MKALRNFSIIVVALLLLMLMTAVFTVTEGQTGILLRLGRLVQASDAAHQVAVFGPGIHLKMPFVDSLRLFDTRLQTLDIKSSRIVTKEKKDVIVDYFVKWRIEDIPQYFKSTGGIALKAETLLEQQLNTSLRAEFGKRSISELVSAVRDDMMELLRSKAEVQARQLGIHVVDVRIKGIELPENTSNAIYQRMRADMQKIANRHRADGSAAAEAIQAEADAKVTVLLAQAESEGRIARAQGDAQAAGLLNQAFSKNPAFFHFIRSLEAYRASFQSKQDMLILDPSSAFFEVFRTGKSQKK